MNRILLLSSLSVSAAIIAAHEKGISNSEIFHVANRLEQLDRQRNLVAKPAEIIQQMAKRGVSKDNWNLILDSKLTRGQIAYTITKHQEQQTAAKKAVAQRNKQKAIKLSVKLPTVQQSITKLAAKVVTTKVGNQKTIKFSAPLKIITVNVASSC